MEEGQFVSSPSVPEKSVKQLIELMVLVLESLFSFYWLGLHLVYGPITKLASQVFWNKRACSLMWSSFDEMKFCSLHEIKSRDLSLWKAGTASTNIKLVEIIKQYAAMKFLIFFQALPVLYLKIAVCSNQRVSKLPQLLSVIWVLQKRQGLLFGKT